MAASNERNYVAGWIALLLVVGAAIWLTRDPQAGERRDREAALREECIADGRAAFRVANPAAPEMNRDQAADLVGRCFSVARLGSK